MRHAVTQFDIMLSHPKAADCTGRFSLPSLSLSQSQLAHLVYRDNSRSAEAEFHCFIWEIQVIQLERLILKSGCQRSQRLNFVVDRGLGSVTSCGGSLCQLSLDYPTGQH